MVDLWIFVFVIIMFLIGYLFKKCDYSNQKNKSLDIIKQPHWYFTVGIMGIICFSVIGLYFILNQRELDSAIIMFVFNIPYFIIILFEKNWRVVFKENEFEFRNLFGKVKMYDYKSIETKDTGRSLIIYLNKKRVVSISFLIKNVDLFQQKINKYKKSSSHIC